MDELEDTVGKLSLTANEWRPGQGYSSSTIASGTETSGRQASVDSATSMGSSSWWNFNKEDDGTNNDINSSSTLPNPHHSRTLPRTTLRSLSLPPTPHQHYRSLSLYSTAEMSPDDTRHKAIPPSFCRAWALEPSFDGTRSSFGYPSVVFRVTSTTDGNLYVLRRVDSAMKVSHKVCQSVLQNWLDQGGVSGGGSSVGGAFHHPGVVRFYKCFLSQRALFFVHHYHAGAITFKQRFFSNEHSNQNNTRTNIPLPESFIWSCLTQLISAILAIHGSNLAVRTLQLNHILCTQEGYHGRCTSYGIPKVRLRINCVGVIDVLEFECRKTLQELQSEDMRMLGCLLLSMTTGTEVTMSDIYRNNTQPAVILNQYLEFVRQNYSRDLHSLIESLLNPNMAPPPVRVVAGNMAMRAFDELDEIHTSMDGMHDALLGVYESGRGLRLMLKLAFVNERPEFGIDRRWSESGDCYILKLFRDFVFHQADGNGRPAMDLGHVISSLNKLDAADEEKIVLTSRDGKNVLVVSYADVALCLEKAYQELVSNSVPHPVVQ